MQWSSLENAQVIGPSSGSEIGTNKTFVEWKMEKVKEGRKRGKSKEG